MWPSRIAVQSTGSPYEALGHLRALRPRGTPPHASCRARTGSVGRLGPIAARVRARGLPPESGASQHCHRMWRLELRVIQDRAPTTSAWHRAERRWRSWWRASRSRTTATASRSRSHSSTAGYAADQWASSFPASGSTTPASSPRRRARAPSPISTATPGSCATAAIRSSSWPRSPTYLEVAYLLLNGELPTAAEVRDVERRRSRSTRSSTRTCASASSRVPLRRPPDGHAGLGGGRPVDLLPRRQGHLRSRVARQADHPADRQDADARRGRPPLQRRHALRLPRQLPRLHRPTSCR